MRILHTADLHLGQTLYQCYDRTDEHDHLFRQLARWCREERPDALVVSGDVFDIQQPGAAAWRHFTERFVALRRAAPAMRIVITAGNHDSASRVEAHQAVWRLAGTRMVGFPPPAEPDAEPGWEERFIDRTEAGYVIALPYMSAPRGRAAQRLLDLVAKENSGGKPVVMAAHLAVAGGDAAGHGTEVGNVAALPVEALGSGYDYLALGHYHMPQTIGHPRDRMAERAAYPSPVARYSGSPLRVSFDEAYPHTVSLVDIDRRGGEVRVRQLRVEPLRHFHTLPPGSAAYPTAHEALDGLRRFIQEGGKGYTRLRISARAALPPDFRQAVHALTVPTQGAVRYNPRVEWAGELPEAEADSARPLLEVAEIQQMDDPVAFIEATRDKYPELDMDEVRRAFRMAREEMRRLDERSDATRARSGEDGP